MHLQEGSLSGLAISKWSEEVFSFPSMPDIPSRETLLQGRVKPKGRTQSQQAA